MPGCLVPGCTSGYKSNFEKVHFFTVPKDDLLKQKWQIALKRPNTLVSKTQVVCEKHFLFEDIIRCRHLLDSEGNVLGVSPYRRPRLRPTTVPSLFPWTEIIPATDESDNISKSIPNSSQVSGSLGASNMSEEIEMSECIETSNMSEEMEISECIGTNNTLDVIKVGEFSELYLSTERQETITNSIQNPNSSNILENFNFSTLLSCDMDLPASWMRNNITYNGKSLISFAFISCEMVDGTYYSFNLKEIIVDSTLKLHTHILEKPLMDSSYVSVKNSITSIQELEEYIRKINGLQVCKGTAICGLQQYEKSTSLYTDKRNTIRHKACTLLCYSFQCNACQNAKRALIRKRKRHEINLMNKKLQGQEIRVGSETKGPENTYVNKLKKKLNRSMEQKKNYGK